MVSFANCFLLCCSCMRDDDSKYLQIWSENNLFFSLTKATWESTRPLTSSWNHRPPLSQERFDRFAETINRKPLSHRGCSSESAPSRRPAQMRAGWGTGSAAVLSIADIPQRNPMPGGDCTPVCLAGSHLSLSASVTFPAQREFAETSIPNVNLSGKHAETKDPVGEPVYRSSSRARMFPQCKDGSWFWAGQRYWAQISSWKRGAVWVAWSFWYIQSKKKADLTVLLGLTSIYN